ncbi:MAG: hypothetical protein V3S20_00945 [Dehalococcoidia bacterium]
MKSLLITAAAVAVLALGALAIGGAASIAQEGDGPIETFLGKVAEKLGVGEDELQTAIDEARDETLDEAVDEGLLTEEQAERLLDRAGKGGFMFPPRQRDGDGQVRKASGLIAEAVVEVLGIQKEEIKEARMDGQSLAEIADGQGMSAEDLSAALLGQVQAQLDDLVSDERITQEQADNIFERLEESIGDLIAGEYPGPGGFGGPRHGRRGFGGFGGPQHGSFGDTPETAEPSGVTA